MEAQSLRTELNFLSNLIKNHKNNKRQTFGAAYKPIQYKAPQPKLKYSVHLKRYSNTFQPRNNNFTTIKRTSFPDVKSLKLFPKPNPSEMVKSPVISAKDTAHWPRRSGSVIPTATSTPVISRNSKPNKLNNHKVPVTPKNKYKLVKNLKNVISSRAAFSSSRTISRCNKFKFVNKAAALPVSSNFKTYRKVHIGGLLKPKWVGFGFGVNNVLKYQRFLYLKSKSPRLMYHQYHNKANTQLRMGKIARNQKCQKNMKLVSIGGLMYRATSTKLSRAKPLSKPEKVAKLASASSKLKYLNVRGVRYKVNKAGNTLTRVNKNWTGTSFNASNTSRIDLGGKTFVRNKNGVFVVSQANQARSFANRAIHKSINHVLNRSKKVLKKNNQHCIFYIRFGKCVKGSSCNYVHDPDKIAVCTRYLRGTCKISKCPFSHKIAPEKMPVCSYFLQGRCGNENCAYRHVKVSSTALICADFLKGYCPAGDKCKKLHTLDCQAFKKDGVCPKGKDCPLRHEKRSRKRKISVHLEKEAKTKKPKNASMISMDKFPSFISINSSTSSEKSFSEEKDSPFKIKPRFLKKIG